MKYSIAAHPTRYSNVLFRSRLEARWAAFFDLVGWKWDYEPIDLVGWTPDFRVEFPCSHSECGGRHVLLVEVKPHSSILEFSGHPCMNYPYGDGIPADASAAFGINPRVSIWEMVHGHGGGEETIENWVSGDIDEIWKIAGEYTQYNPSGENHA